VALDGVRVDDWSQRVRQLQNSAIRLKSVRDQLTTELVSKEEEIAELTRRQEVLTKVSELYRVLMDQMVMGQVRTIEAIVSEGLRTIFFDQDLSFKAEVGTSRGKVSVDFFICQGDPEKGGIKGPPLDAFGGGPTSIASLILRILTLLRLKRKRILLLDETLAAVSDDYIEATGQFLQKLAEGSELSLLMVTHKPAFLDHASRSYQGDTKTEGVRNEFVVKKLRGAA
jgi:DNA repair ATPase RecN